MIKYWTGLNTRERMLVLVAAGVLSLLLLWQFAYKPISKFPQTNARAYKKAELNLKIIQKGQRVLASQNSGSVRIVEVLKPTQLQGKISETAKKNGLVITRRKPGASGEITMWLEDIDSQNFYGWVDNLTAGYNIKLDRAQLNRNDDGTIRAKVTFKMAKTVAGKS